MFAKYSSLALIMATMAVGAPLNINLGAYSPAVVVGDGEISFAGGAGGAEGLVNTLQGASQSSAGAVAEGAAIAPATGTEAQLQTVQRSPVLSEPASLPVPGVTRGLSSRDVDQVEKRQEEAGGLAKRQTGFDRALLFAEAALVKGPKVQLGTGEGGAGVGIIVDNNPEAAARAGTGAAE